MARFSTGLPAVVAAALVFVVACNGEPRFPSHSPADGDPALVTADDTAAYQAIIDAYAQAGQLLMLQPAPGPPPGATTTASEPERSPAERLVQLRPYTMKNREVAPEPDRWWTLDGKTRPRIHVPRSAVNDFKTRNSRKASLKAFRPRNLRVEWSEKAEPMTCLFAFTLPGYSRSKDAAIVEIACESPAFGGGAELLYLERKGRTWRVVAKQQTWIS